MFLPREIGLSHIIFLMMSLSATPANAIDTQLKLPYDLSPWGMFMAADLVVKTVMVVLAFASFLTWVILLAKGFEIIRARRAVRQDISMLRQQKTLDGAAQILPKKSATSALVGTATQECNISQGLGSEGIKERVALSLSRSEAGFGRAISSGIGILATIGAISPFIGLFGTVWGIMNSFIGISVTKTTNLAVVAPGIAEALLATAIGLVAAIPAVVIYNGFSRAISHYRALLSDASALILTHLSRDLERGEPERQPLRLAAE